MWLIYCTWGPTLDGSSHRSSWSTHREGSGAFGKFKMHAVGFSLAVQGQLAWAFIPRTPANKQTGATLLGNLTQAFPRLPSATWLDPLQKPKRLSYFSLLLGVGMLSSETLNKFLFPHVQKGVTPLLRHKVIVRMNGHNECECSILYSHP